MISTSGIPYDKVQSYQTKIIRAGAIVRNVYSTWSCAARGTKTGVRDKARFVFWQVYGYLPQYAYSVIHYDYKPWPVLPRIVVRTGAGEVWDTTSALGLPYFYVNSPHIDFTAQVTLPSNAAYAKLNTKVRDQRYSAFELLYEGPKTCRMILSATADVLAAMKDVRKGRFHRAASRLGLASTPKGARKGRRLQDNWLEFRYGWQPIYLSIYGEMTRQYDRMRARPPVYSAAGQAEGPIVTTVGYTTGDNTTIPDNGGWNTFFSWSIYATTKKQVRVRYKAFYSLQNDLLNQSTQLGLTNPALLLWEYLPFSFVADWFVNVGQYLAQFDTWTGKTFLDGTKTVTSIASQSKRAAVSATAGNTLVSKSNLDYWVGTRTETVRTKLLNPPPVPIRFDMGLNTIRTIDGISLFAQQVRRLK